MSIDDFHVGGPVAGSTKSKTASLSPEDQIDFDLEFYGKILARNPDNVDALRQQVELLAVRGDHQGALKLDERLVELRPFDKIARYNQACSLAMLGRLHPAVEALEMAIQLGYSDIAHLEADADLDPLRCIAEFWVMLERYGFC